MTAPLPVPDAPGVAIDGLAQVAPRRRPPTDPPHVVGLAVVAAVPSLAAAAEEAVVGPSGVPPIALLSSLARRALPLGLAKGVALKATATLPSGATDGVVLLGGKATLAPVVVTARATPGADTGLVLATRPSKARAAVHVGGRGVTPPRPETSRDAATSP